jgi:ABC-type multidrug transport system fused ATPase/permease subunit
MVALGDATAAATEAFSNIRTVRSFSAEKMEEAKYEKHTAIALRTGMTEAFGGALSNILSQYTNLIAGILILWYGGSVIVSCLVAGGDQSSCALTVGKLITFQLYWNMIRGSYETINNVIVQFTTARGSAQRVFEMLDALPDVDLDAGKLLDRRDVRGEFELRDVVFAYQMRPKERVLNGINLTIAGGSTVPTLSLSVSVSVCLCIPPKKSLLPLISQSFSTEIIVYVGAGGVRRQVGRRQVDSRASINALLRPRRRSDLPGRPQTDRPQPALAA